MEIKTITKDNSGDFDDAVNRLLSNGWSLHGDPKVNTVSEKDTWDGNSYSRAITTYVQILKR